jgi:hypothetical protein
MAWTKKDGWVWAFCCVDHYSAEAWTIVAKRGDGFACLEPLSDAVTERFGRVDKDLARGISFRHAWGLQNPTVRANSSHITRANVRAKLRANTTHRFTNGVQAVPLKNRVRVPVAPRGDENVINPTVAAATPRPSTILSPPEGLSLSTIILYSVARRWAVLGLPFSPRRTSLTNRFIFASARRCLLTLPGLIRLRWASSAIPGAGWMVPCDRAAVVDSLQSIPWIAVLDVIESMIFDRAEPLFDGIDPQPLIPPCIVGSPPSAPHGAEGAS